MSHNPRPRLAPGSAVGMHADLDCLFPPVAAAASTGSERRHRQIRIADSSFAVGDLHLAGDTARAFSHRSFRAAQPYADCPGVLPLPCPLSREPFRSSCPSFRMESALPYCSLLQTNLSPCPCPWRDGRCATAIFPKRSTPTQQAVRGPRENAFLALAALQNYQAPEEGVLPSAGQR